MQFNSPKLNRWRSLALVLTAGVLFAVNLSLYSRIFSFEPPKTILLKRENADLKRQARIYDRALKVYEGRLADLEARDENVYRSIFGLNSIPAEQRQAGLQGHSHYDDLKKVDTVGEVSAQRKRVDDLKKRAFVQSRSYDEIELMLHNAGDMANSMPAICPVLVSPETFRISSAFGVRVDPVFGRRSFHKGMDFAGPAGNPVFATGDAVVEQVKIEKRGYGNQVVLNHGFGYQTRYAHLKVVLVAEGMRIKRGDLIAISGNSGKSTGPHLHYEVIYKGHRVNPYHYFDRDLPVEQYKQMVKYSEQPNQFFVHPSHKNNVRKKNSKR